MKEIILNVPDHKVDFIMELIEQLGLESNENSKFWQSIKRLFEAVYRNQKRIQNDY